MSKHINYNRHLLIVIFACTILNCSGQIRIRVDTTNHVVRFVNALGVPKDEVDYYTGDVSTGVHAEHFYLVSKSFDAFGSYLLLYKLLMKKNRIRVREMYSCSIKDCFKNIDKD